MFRFFSLGKMNNKRIRVSGLLFFLFGVSFLFIVNSLEAKESEKPNIVLIMADDQGWGDIESHDNPWLKTPELDQLVSEGARLNRFFVSPVCAPTRASLLTGRYHLRTGVHGVTRGYENMRAEEVTIAEILSKNGYATGAFGKWHNGRHFPNHPNGQGFREFFGFCGGHWNTYFNTTLERNRKPVSTEGYITDVLTDEAIHFIKQNKAKPFFCYVPYNTPHSPWTIADKYWNKYDSPDLDEMARCAYAMVDNIDWNVGRLMKTLKENNLDQNTIVIYLSDNGPNSKRYNGNMKGRKGSVHEGGMRVPFFIRYPDKIKPGVEIDTIHAHIDILPTLLEYCGISVPEELQIDGKSFVSRIENPKGPVEDRQIFQHWRERKAVRTEQWRAANEKRGWELYDMVKDPDQKNDLAKQKPEVLKQLVADYDKWYEDVMKKGLDPMPIPIGYAEAPEVSLPANEAFLYPEQADGINYTGTNRRGYANSWIDQWNRKEAYPYWPIDVIQPGTYEVSVEYNCKKENVNPRFLLTNGQSQLEFQLTEPFFSELVSEEDRISPADHYGVKDWKTVKVGKISLAKGISELKLKPVEMPGEELIELKSIQLKKVNP